MAVETRNPGALFDIALDALILDPKLQPRERMDESTIGDYGAALEGGAVFPPVVAYGDPDGGPRWLADGFHRVAAHVAAGRQTIRCEVRPGGWREALLHAAGANAQHGLRRTNADKRRAVRRLLEDEEWGERSNPWIAEACAVDQSTVFRIRAEFDAERAAAPASGFAMQNPTPATARAGRGGTRQAGKKRARSHARPEQHPALIVPAPAEDDPLEQSPLVRAMGDFLDAARALVRHAPEAMARETDPLIAAAVADDLDALCAWIGRASRALRGTA